MPNELLDLVMYKPLYERPRRKTPPDTVFPHYVGVIIRGYILRIPGAYVHHWRGGGITFSYTTTIRPFGQLPWRIPRASSQVSRPRRIADAPTLRLPRRTSYHHHCFRKQRSSSRRKTLLPVVEEGHGLLTYRAGREDMSQAIFYPRDPLTKTIPEMFNVGCGRVIF